MKVARGNNICALACVHHMRCQLRFRKGFQAQRQKLLTAQREIDFLGDGDRRLNVELDPARVIRKLWSVCAKAPVVQNGDGTATEVAPGIAWCRCARPED